MDISGNMHSQRPRTANNRDTCTLYTEPTSTKGTVEDPEWSARNSWPMLLYARWLSWLAGMLWLSVASTPGSMLINYLIRPPER